MPLALPPRLRREVAGRRAGARARVRGAAPAVAQAAGAAAAAWVIAHDVLHHPQPFFAPIAAVVSLSAASGQRGRRAVEMMLGVVVGIAIADGIVSLLGTGAVQLALVIALAMCAAFALSDSLMLVNQAAASAILVVALHRSGVAGERVFDALVGGGCALVASQLLFPARPLALLRRAQRDVLRSLGDALREAAAALRDPGSDRIQWALETAARIHVKLAALATARSMAPEIARTSPTRRRSLNTVARSADAAVVLDLLANATLTLVRDAARLVDDREPGPDWLPAAVEALAEAAYTLADDFDGLEAAAAARERTLAAASLTASDAARPADPHRATLANDVRIAAVDLLRISGLDRRSARAAVRAARRPGGGPAAAEPVEQPSAADGR